MNKNNNNSPSSSSDAFALLYSKMNQIVNTIASNISEIQARKQENCEIFDRVNQLATLVEKKLTLSSPLPPLASFSSKSLPLSSSLSILFPATKHEKLANFSEPTPSLSLANWIFACQQFFHDFEIPPFKQTSYTIHHLERIACM